jgi:hypothetical protein
MAMLTEEQSTEAELILNDHDGPSVIPGRYAGPAIPISTGLTPQQVTEAARKADADRLAGQICAAAALSAQATCALLELVAEFDATGAIRYWTEVKSLAHWLSWSCSMAPGVAREHVRVARALPKMPTVHAAFRAGRLSYSKVREISRVVDIIDETRLCAMATTATAAQLATVISTFRSCERRRIGQHTQRRMSWQHRDDGMVDLRARLTKEDAAILVAAIHAAKDQYGTIPTKPDPTDDEPANLEVGAYTTVDALVDVGRVFLDTTPADRSGEDRTLVVVHVSAELLAESVPAGTSPPEANTCHIEGQGPLEPATAQRLACDNPLLPAIIADGEILTLGRTRRLVTRAQRRALMIRDRMCRYPGCHQTRHLKAHHIRSWATGGTTDLSNLILLCQFHHTTVHEGHLTITRTDDRWEFTMPDGTACQHWHTDVPLANRLRYLNNQQHIEEVDSFRHPDAKTIQPRWAGEPFNIHDCVQALYRMKLPQTEDQQAA